MRSSALPPLRIGASVAAAALLTRTPRGREGLNGVLRHLPFRRELAN